MQVRNLSAPHRDENWLGRFHAVIKAMATTLCSRRCATSIRSISLRRPRRLVVIAVITAQPDHKTPANITH